MLEIFFEIMINVQTNNIGRWLEKHRLFYFSKSRLKNLTG